MTVTQPAESGMKARTRKAILDAAILVLGGNPKASLAEVAEIAQVGRTTLHRYFPERSDLLRALSVEGLERIKEASARAHLADGTGRQALLRLCREYFGLGSLLTLIFSEPQLAQSEDWAENGEVDAELLAAIERGYVDGTIDRDSPALWVQNMLWCMLYAGWSYVTENKMPTHAALDQVLRSLEGAVASRDPQPETTS